MVIKGNPRGSPGDLAKHLQRTDTNARMEVKEVRGVAALDLTGALREMDACGAALRTTRTLYHASINVRADEHLTDAERTQAVDQLETALGLAGQPRVVVEHEKEGRAHWHVVWGRTDLENMRAIRCDHNYRTHEEVARALEKEFGHARVQGAHVGREGPDGERGLRPDRTPSHAEMQQAERSGVTPKEAKVWLTTLWQATDSGKAFAAAIENQGWKLARGDKRDFVVLDPAGETHSLARRIDGAKAKDIRARLADIDPASLPTVTAARAQQEAAQIKAARDQVAARAEAVREQERQAEAARQAELQRQQREAKQQRENARRDEEVRQLAAFQAARAKEAEQRAKVTETKPQLVPPQLVPPVIPQPVRIAAKVAEKAVEQTAATGIRVASKGVHGVARATESLLKVVDGLLDFFVGAPAAPQFSAADYATNSAARQQLRAQEAAQQASARERDAALDRMREDRAAGKDLSAADLRSLHREDLENIKARGDAHLLHLIKQREEELRRAFSSGRERERER